MLLKFTFFLSINCTICLLSTYNLGCAFSIYQNICRFIFLLRVIKRFLFQGNPFICQNMKFVQSHCAQIKRIINSLVAMSTHKTT